MGRASREATDDEAAHGTLAPPEKSQKRSALQLFWRELPFYLYINEELID